MEDDLTETDKACFLRLTNVTREEDALQNCILAAFRRNKMYKDNVLQSERYELRNDLKVELRSLSASYLLGGVSEADHEANIQHLSNVLSAKHGAMLTDGRFKIGTSQKALNLYLKFLWCLDRLPDEPVHCPVDRIILTRVLIYGAWTQLDDIQSYREWISRIRAAVEPQSLSTWELGAWR